MNPGIERPDLVGIKLSTRSGPSLFPEKINFAGDLLNSKQLFMNKTLLLLFLSLLVFAGSCNRNKKEKLTILKITEHGSAKVSDSAIIKVLENHTNLNVQILYDLNEEVALDGLRKKTIDMAIIPSNTIVNENEMSIRTVMPLLPRILMIVTKPGSKAGTLKDLLENNFVIYEDMSRMDSLFFNKLFRSFHIDPKKINGTLVGNYTLKDPNGSASVYIGLTHLHNPSVLKLLESGWSLFSLDKVSRLGHGSAAEGFQMAYPWAYPYVFPKDYYAGKPDEPVLTVAIHDVLVSRNDLEPEKVYEVVSTLIENKSNLVRQNDIYTQLETDISKCRMSFPLQKGTINYLNRDKPSIWVRYANMLWPVLSVLAIFWGAIVSFQKRLKKQLKERIDKYYSELLHIRGKAFDDKYEGSKEELLEKLMHIRSRAFNSLKNNKLVADDSFIIFLRLYQEILDEIATKK